MDGRSVNGNVVGHTVSEVTYGGLQERTRTRSNQFTLNGYIERNRKKGFDRVRLCKCLQTWVKLK